MRLHTINQLLQLTTAKCGSRVELENGAFIGPYSRVIAVDENNTTLAVDSLVRLVANSVLYQREGATRGDSLSYRIGTTVEIRTIAQCNLTRLGGVRLQMETRRRIARYSDGH